MSNDERHRRHRLPKHPSLRAFVWGLGLLFAAAVRAAVPEVAPTGFELDGPGVNVDDPCFWVDAADPSHALVFVTTKSSGLVEAFDLVTGTFVASIPGFGRPNNCAVEGDVLLTTDKDASNVRMHHLPDLTPIGTFGAGLHEPEGIDLLHTPDGKTLVFVTDSFDASVHVYDFADGSLIRAFPTGFGLAIEPVLADDLYQRVFVAREEGGTGHGFGVFTPEGTLVGEMHASIFARDTEGMALYECGADGYLVVSDQQSDATEFEVFERASLAHIGTFNVQDGAGDFTDSTDGLDILQTPVPGFPNGVLATCDGCGSKLPDEMDVVGWDAIADALWLERCPGGVAPDCTAGPCRWRVPVTADAAVSALTPDVNVGTDVALYVDTEPAEETFLRFEVPDLTGYDLLAAKVRLTLDRVAGSDGQGGGTLSATTLDWSEAGITWTNRPVAIGPALGTVGAVKEQQVVDFDVRDVVGGGGPYAFVLQGNSNNRVRYRSREALESPPALLLAVQRSQPPVLTITAPANGATVPAGTPVTLTATATDPEDGDLSAEVRWRSSLGGYLGKGGTLMVGTLASGVHTLTADVVDRAGRSASAAVELRVGAAPKVTITNPIEGARVPAGSAIRLIGSALDTTDGDLTAGLTWLSDRQGNLGKGGNFLVVLKEGVHRLTARATNTQGTTGTAQVNLTITPTAPFVRINTPVAGTIGAAGTSITFTGTAGDSTDGNLTGSLMWSSDLKGPLGKGGTLATAALGPGLHVVSATSTDSGGLVGRASIALSVVPASASIVTSADVYVHQNTPTENFGSVKTLDARRSGAEILSLLRFPIAYPPGTMLDRAVLRMTVSTGTGSNSVNGGSITAIPDTGWQEKTVTYATRPPVTGPVLATRGAVALGEVVEFDVTAGIAGPGNAVFALTNGSTDTVKYKSRESTAPPALLLSLRAAPTTGTAPAVVVLTPASGSSFGGATQITFRGRATDVEDGDLSTSIAWSSDRSGPLGHGAQVIATLPGGTHQIRAISTDRSGRSGIAEITVRVNGRPTVTITQPATGATLMGSEPVRLIGRADDAEDGDLSPTMVWTSDRAGTLGTGASLLAPLGPGVHKITASARDSAGQEGNASVNVTVADVTGLSVDAAADATVRSELPDNNYGRTASILADGAPVRRAYLRFVVAGIGTRRIVGAKLRLTTLSDSASGSQSGGTLHAVTGAWEERVVTFTNGPAFDAIPVATGGAAVPGQVVEFDLGGVVTGDGTYSFGLKTALDKVGYASREAVSGGPRLVLTLE
jgi:myo-inositol-hexaphosphate 3-phosphohydrolase